MWLPVNGGLRYGFIQRAVVFSLAFANNTLYAGGLISRAGPQGPSEVVVLRVSLSLSGSLWFCVTSFFRRGSDASRVRRMRLRHTT
jgi:hypothetical protein